MGELRDTHHPLNNKKTPSLGCLFLVYFTIAKSITSWMSWT